MTRVALQHGIVSGTRHSVRFRRALRTAGYHLVKDSRQADIIIAHSAGNFLLPPAPTHQKLLLVDPPYWPGRTVAERRTSRQKTRRQYRQHGYSLPYFVRDTAWHYYYFGRDLKRTMMLAKLADSYDLATVIRGHQAILVRNHADDWLTPELDDLQKDNPQLIVKHLPGDHDDIWHNPRPYIELLKLLA